MPPVLLEFQMVDGCQNKSGCSKFWARIRAVTQQPAQLYSIAFQGTEQTLKALTLLSA